MNIVLFTTIRDIKDEKMKMGGLASTIALTIMLYCQMMVMVESVDECAAGLHTCPQNSACSDADESKNGTAICTCNEGYTGNSTICKDIIECDSGDPCNGTGGVCENTIGSFACFCKPNFEKVNGTCQDIDECAKGTHVCHKDAECSNVEGNHNCTCKSGYTGDGKLCEDIDECSKSLHQCHTDASCKNVPGSYVCICNVTVASGKSCEVSSYCPAVDVDECANGKHNCHKDAVCRNVVGSYICICKSGFSGDGMNCSKIEDDDNENTVIILVSVAIGLLAICFFGLIIAIIVFYRLKSK